MALAKGETGAPHFLDGLPGDLRHEPPRDDVEADSER